MKSMLIVILVVSLSGCALVQGARFGETYAEEQAGYSYIPLEPSSVGMTCKDEPCGKVSKRKLLAALPDNSVRIATRLVSGTSSFGIPAFGADIGIAGNTYEVIIDFVNTQTVNKQFSGKWFVNVRDHVEVRPNRCYPFERSVLEKPSVDKYEQWTLRASITDERDITSDLYRTKVDQFNTYEQDRTENKRIVLTCGKQRNSRNGETIPYDAIQITPEPFNIPVYIGIGLRLRANVTVLKGTVNLSSLPALTAAVSAERATGTMSVQTIGVSGKAARSNLLLLDKIDATTIQNAIQVLASIKASIESEDTTIAPRIVGFHNTIGAGSQGVNLIHSLLASLADLNLDLDDSAYADGASASATVDGAGL